MTREGTGKTLTALGGLSLLAEKLNNKLGIIIICPYQHLVEQWVEDIKACGVDPIICYSVYNWKKGFRRTLRNFNMGIIEKFLQRGKRIRITLDRQINTYI